MYAADIVVRDPYRVVGFLGVNHKIPRTSLVQKTHYNIKTIRKDVRDFVDSLLYKLLLVLPSELVEPSGKDSEQQDEENHDE